MKKIIVGMITGMGIGGCAYAYMMSNKRMRKKAEKIINNALADASRIFS